MKERDKTEFLTREELFALFRASGEVDFKKFLDTYIQFVYPEEDTLQ